MKTVYIFISILIALPTAPSSAQVVVQHIGANDPESEGFNRGIFGEPDIGAVFDDFGRDAWSFDSRGAAVGHYYTHQISTEHRQAAIVQGWELTAEMRIVVPGQGGVFKFGADIRSYWIFLELTSVGNILVRNGGDIIYTLEDGGTGYHSYALTYNAVDETAALWIDGNLRVNNVASSLSSPEGSLYFGMGGAGHTHWSELNLTIIPEPAAVALWAGTGTLLLIGVFRWRKLSKTGLS